MKVIAVESSCDDTAVAIVNSNKIIISNIVITQHKDHALYKGIVPEVAARSHLNNLKPAISQVMQDTRIALSEVDAVAATAGPGLIGSVTVGSVFAKSIAITLAKRFIPIHHLEGHILAARLCHDISFPYLTLLVSGGHCMFIAVLGVGQYHVLGYGLDDAVGEVFDKIARVLGLEYPGGPVIEQLAYMGDKHKYKLPLSMVSKQGCDMSFSGLKTAVIHVIHNLTTLSQQVIYDICASLQYTISNILLQRTINAIKLFDNYCITQGISKPSSPRVFVLTGGVASNQYIRDTIFQAIQCYGYTGVAPLRHLCTDNAAMIAWAALERIKANKLGSDILIPRAKWNIMDI